MTMVNFDIQKIIEKNLEYLLYEIDNRRGIFSGFIYTGLRDIFNEPPIKEIGLDQSQVETAFMARRLQQAMPLSARMSPAEENSLDAIIKSVSLWKERTGYIYQDTANSLEHSAPRGADAKFVYSVVNDYFSSLNLKDISSTKTDGYLTWKGVESLERISLRFTFDIRKKYNWRMRFNIGVFLKDGTLICNISDWETFGKIIYAVVDLPFNFDFEYCDTVSSNFIFLKNYLGISLSILNKVKLW